MREKDVCHHCGADKRDMARLTRERDEARATERLWKVCELAYPEEGWTVLEATTAEEAQRQYESSCGGRPDGIEPDEEWLTATPFTLEDLEAMDAENERLRQALEEATRALAVDPRYLSPARLGTARSILAAALAGEGEVLDRAHTVDVDLCMVHAVDMQPAPVDEHQVNKTRMLRFRLRQGEPLYIRLTQGRQIVIKVDPRYGGAGEEPTHTPTPEQARPA